VSGDETPVPSKSIPPWRAGAGIAVLLALAAVGALLIPVYLHNMELERFVRDQPAGSDEAIRQAIVDKGRSLGLDIALDHLQIKRLAGGETQVRYVVRVTLPLYTVDLHFSSNLKGDFPRQ